jgi:3-oxoacyl-ACP reductase-like protein
LLSPTAGPASIEDVPIHAIEILAVIVSPKLKKQLSEVPPSKSIKELFNGKLTLQNKIWVTSKTSFYLHPTRGASAGGA